MHHDPNDSEAGRPYTEGIALRPLLLAVWAKRWHLGVGLVAIVALSVVGAAGIWVWSPTERVAQVGFRLVFDGADQGRREAVG